MDKWTEHDYPELFDQLPADRQQALIHWIEENLMPRKSFNNRYTSYGLKHRVTFPDNMDPYFYNGAFKGAMLKAGFSVRDSKALNWVFNISDKSPLFKQKD
ncbi:MAG: hypothetical protein RR461_11205 [Angelakisella sp.]